MAELVLPRVIFAPVNSGSLTLAEARLALVSWLVARKAGGAWVIRVDDFVGGSSEGPARLSRDLSWLGLHADEGLDRGGFFAPYSQASRDGVYAYYAEKLLQEQSAFRCFCGASVATFEERCGSGCERLAAGRVEQLLREGAPSVVRLRGQAGDIMLEDFVRGSVRMRGESVGEPVLITAKGSPSAELRAAVDDTLMLITHAVRDEAALPFTLRQMLICRALEWELPCVAHLPTLQPSPQLDAATPLSQVTIEALRREGYLPGTVLGFLAYLAGMDDGDVVVESAEELVPRFDPRRLSLQARPLDFELLRTASRRQLAVLRDEELRAALQPFLAKSGLADDDPRLPELVSLFREWAVTIGELAQKLSLFGKDPVPVIDRSAVKYLRRESSQKVLWSLIRQMRPLAQLDQEIFTKLMANVRRETGIMGKDLWTPVRMALTGETDGPPLPQVVALLGKEAVVKLIERSLSGQT